MILIFRLQLNEIMKILLLIVAVPESKPRDVTMPGKIIELHPRAMKKLAFKFGF